MIIRKAVKQDLPQLQVMYEAIIAHMYAQQICIWGCGVSLHLFSGGY